MNSVECADARSSFHTVSSRNGRARTRAFSSLVKPSSSGEWSIAHDASAAAYAALEKEKRVVLSDYEPKAGDIPIVGSEVGRDRPVGADGQVCLPGQSLSVDECRQAVARSPAKCACCGNGPSQPCIGPAGSGSARCSFRFGGEGRCTASALGLGLPRRPASPHRSSRRPAHPLPGRGSRPASRQRTQPEAS